MPEITKHGPSEAPDPRRAAEIEEIRVAEWCPTPDGTGPAEQVHMLIRVRGLGTSLVLRMKTGRAVDAIADALAEYRRNVFGPRG